MLEAEGLVLKGIYMSHVRVGCQAKLFIASICLIGVKDREVMRIIGPSVTLPPPQIYFSLLLYFSSSYLIID
jgi:hypothetical protein